MSPCRALGWPSSRLGIRWLPTASAGAPGAELSRGQQGELTESVPGGFFDLPRGPGVGVIDMPGQAEAR